VRHGWGWASGQLRLTYEAANHRGWRARILENLDQAEDPALCSEEQKGLRVWDDI
jgi:hypothetical protein